MAMQRLRGLLRGGVACGLLCGMIVAPPALAQQAPAPALALVAPDLPGAADSKDQAIADIGALVAYALPYAFDVMVFVGRSFAVVSYGTRRYDAITGSFVITDLRITRDTFQMAIDQLRLALTETMIDGLTIDTRPLPLDPAVRDVLKQLDRETLTLNASIVSEVDPSDGDVRFAMTVSGEEIALLEAAADLRAFHILAPIEGMTPAGQDVQLSGRLMSARIDLDDRGLVEAIATVLGKTNGLNAAQARDMASAMAGIGVASMFASLPGGSTPELDKAAQSWSAAVQAFLRDPNHLSIRLDPAQPFDFSTFNDGKVLAGDVLALGPSVTNGAKERLPLISNAAAAAAAEDPSQEDALSFALIEGRGLPQDIPRAVAMLEPRLLAGDASAASSLARALVLNPQAEMSQDALSRLYVAVLLARAERSGVEPGLAETLTTRLSPAELAAAEEAAAEAWGETDDGLQAAAVEAEYLAARDWATLRRIAYAYYEGIDRPRNRQRAYAFANVAAAGDDKAASLLRDKLAEARAKGEVMWSKDETAERIASMWALVLPATDATEAVEDDPASATPEIPSSPDEETQERPNAE